MRIDHLELKNFKKFEAASFEFSRTEKEQLGSFHVLVGKNGIGKTTVLDALAVALGIWLERVPDSLLASSHRRLTDDQKRETAVRTGDRLLPMQAPGEMLVQASGTLLERTSISWGQVLGEGKRKVSNRASKEALTLVAQAYKRIQAGENLLLPVIAYYGAGRAWLPHNQRKQIKAKANGAANRWEAFYDCLNDRIRLADLNNWFRTEAIERGNRGGTYRPGFEVVLKAAFQIVPGADGLHYDADREEIVLSINGNPQLFGNLSAGQRCLFALVADIAIKMVTQNNYLVPADRLGPEDEPLPRVLKQTPGVILIDELDVHLHPQWQRRIVADLKRTFPAIQFITTTHSPQIIGELKPTEICLLREQGGVDTPVQSFGMDSNWILQVLMETDEQDPAVKHELEAIGQMTHERKLDEAALRVTKLRGQIGNSEALQRAASTIERIRILNR